MLVDPEDPEKDDNSVYVSSYESSRVLISPTDKRYNPFASHHLGVKQGDYKWVIDAFSDSYILKYEMPISNEWIQRARMKDSIERLRFGQLSDQRDLFMAEALNHWLPPGTIHKLADRFVAAITLVNLIPEQLSDR